MSRALGLAAVGALVVSAPASAFSEWVVDRTDDVDPVAQPASGTCLAAQPDDCTLRGALAMANNTTAGSLITLPAGTYRRDRTLSVLSATQSVTIQGAGARSTIIQGPGAPAFPLGFVLGFTAQPGQATPLTSEIRDVTITGGAGQIFGGGIVILNHRVSLVRVSVTGNLAQGVDAMGTKLPGLGGGVSVASPTARLTVDDSLIAGNRVEGAAAKAAAGAGLLVSGTATVRNSTIAGNIADGGGGPALGGGAAVLSNGSLTLDGVTVAGNGAQNAGGSQAVGNLYRESVGTSTVSLTRTLIADGIAPAGSNTQDCAAPLTSLGGNVEDRDQCGLARPADRVGADAGLGPLQDNGGPTDTRAITQSSPAFDFGGMCSTGDQRGLARAFAACDSGAFEVQPSAPVSGPGGSGPPAGPPSPGPAPAPPTPTAPPRCTLRGTGTTAHLTARIVCDRAARVVLTATATIHNRGARRSRVALRGRTVTVAAGTVTALALAVPPSVVRAVRRGTRVSIALAASVTASAADGGRTRATAAIGRLRPAPSHHRRP